MRSTKRHGSRELYEIQGGWGTRTKQWYFVVLVPGLCEKGHSSRDDTRAEDGGVD